jgi:hypothetical protein
MGKWQSKNKNGKNNPFFVDCVQVKCSGCHCIINLKPHQVGKRNFCSYPCYKEFARGENHPLYGKKQNEEARYKMSLSHGGTGIPGELSEYGPEFDSSLKEQARFRDGYKCQVCGCPQLENSRALDIHHIDYDKENNELNNLVSLCRSCHTKTNTNRIHWKKNIL